MTDIMKREASETNGNKASGVDNNKEMKTWDLEIRCLFFPKNVN